MIRTWVYGLITLATLALFAAACGPAFTVRESRFLSSIDYDIRQNPGNPQLYLKRGKLYLRYCMTKKAIADYTKAYHMGSLVHCPAWRASSVFLANACASVGATRASRPIAYNE